jgi:hypothetical protein
MAGHGTVLAELRHDGAGGLSHRGARYLLIRPETLAALQHALEAALGGAAADCLVAGGRAGGGKATAGSPFAEAYGAAREPVCHLTRGVLEALATSVLSGRPRVTETACAAAGAEACRFEARV